MLRLHRAAWVVLKRTRSLQTLSFLVPAVGAGNLLFGGASKKRSPAQKTREG
jgi:hypothetical protein